jgi:hypothetical protein
VEFANRACLRPLVKVIWIQVLKSIAIVNKEHRSGDKVKDMPETADPTACWVPPLELPPQLFDGPTVIGSIVQDKVSNLVVRDQVVFFQHFHHRYRDVLASVG